MSKFSRLVFVAYMFIEGVPSPNKILVYIHTTILRLIAITITT